MSAGVTFPAGFTAAGVSAGVKPSGAADLALLVGTPGTSVAGLFTTNRVLAAPVTLSRERIAAGRGTAVVVNSGQANAATGERGAADARRIVEAAAAVAGIPVDDMLACSTGVIGEPVHLPEVVEAMPALGAALGPDGGRAFADAIMTTDTVAKTAEVSSGPYRVGGATAASVVTKASIVARFGLIMPTPFAAPPIR